jgi:hypothetical protein
VHFLWRCREGIDDRGGVPPRLGQVDLATLDVAHAAVLEVEAAVDGALDGIGPLLHREHRHLLHHRLHVAVLLQGKTKVLRVHVVEEIRRRKRIK